MSQDNLFFFLSLLAAGASGCYGGQVFRWVWSKLKRDPRPVCVFCKAKTSIFQMVLGPDLTPTSCYVPVCLIHPVAVIADEVMTDDHGRVIPTPEPFVGEDGKPGTRFKYTIKDARTLHGTERKGEAEV